MTQIKSYAQIINRQLTANRVTIMEEELFDIRIVCKNCGTMFIWTTGEQDFMYKLKEKGSVSDVYIPHSCPACRLIKRNARKN